MIYTITRKNNAYMYIISTNRNEYITNTLYNTKLSDYRSMVNLVGFRILISKCNRFTWMLLQL